MPVAAWPDETSLPPLRQRDGMPMSPAEVSDVLQLLRTLPEPARITMEQPHPRQPWRRSALSLDLRASLDALSERCGEQAINDWMAALLRSWLQDIGTGTARKYPWVVPAAGVLGGDACAALLGSHLRGENHSLRCTGEVGVEALVEMATRGALLELAHLGKKFPKKMRGEAAQRALERFAADQQLTPEQLQDRILPDSGLDASGNRAFDYGPRQFALVIDEDLKPALRAPDGKRLTSLPKPNSKDDPALADAARHAWKLAKSQIAQTARWLALRFEAAMITGDTWSATEFDSFFRSHPLGRHVVRRVLWRNTATGVRFRIAEDDTLADCNDAPIDPQSTGSIGPAHPLELDAHELEQWQRMFADYRIVSPFQQLDRPVFRVQDDQRDLRVLTTFPNPVIDVKALVFPLENRGWEREQYGDGGMVNYHTKCIAGSPVVACLQYEPGAFLGDLLSSGLQHLTDLYFVLAKGPSRADALPFSRVPAMVFSETLRDIHGLVPPA